MTDFDFNIVFDGPPAPNAGRFVECETVDGHSFNAGDWHERDDGFWELRIRNRKPSLSEGVTPELVEALRAGGRVIEYAASILWNGRPQAIAQRPAEVDADLRTFRTILAEYEAAAKPPVDPLVIEAREIAAKDNWSGDYRDQILAGDLDESPCVRHTLAGLKRGIELTKAPAS